MLPLALDLSAGANHSIEGFEALYGLGVFHCPYCDGWGVRDRPLAVYGKGDAKGSGLARERIPVREEHTVRLEQRSAPGNEISFEIAFEDAAALERRALFFNTGRRQSIDLATRLGCEMLEATPLQGRQSALGCRSSGPLCGGRRLARCAAGRGGGSRGRAGRDRHQHRAAQGGGPLLRRSLAQRQRPSPLTDLL